MDDQQTDNPAPDQNNLGQQPEAQPPQQPEPTPPTQPQTDFSPPIQPEKKSKKKILIAILFVLLLVAAAAGAWFLLGTDDAVETTNETANNNETTEESLPFTPTYFIQTGPMVEYINSEGNLETVANLATNEVVTDVRNFDGETRVYYYTTQPDDFYSTVISGFGYAVNGEKKSIATLNQTGPTYYSTPYLSPDGSKFIMEGGYEGAGLMGDIYLYDASSGEGEIIYDTNEEGEDRDLFNIVGWLDNSTVIVQDLSCRECDGPRKPILRKINVDNGTLTPFFNENDSIDTLEWAQIYVTNGKIYVYGGNYGKIFGGGEEGEQFAPDELYEVDAQTGEPRLITTFDDEIVQLANIDNNTLYVNLTMLVPTDAEDAPYQSVDGNMDYTEPQLIAVNLSDGSKKQISIETKYYTNRSTADGVYSTESGTLFLTSTSTTKDIDGVQYPGVKYAIFELPNTTETTELKLIKEHETLYDDNGVYLRFFVAQ